MNNSIVDSFVGSNEEGSEALFSQLTTAFAAGKREKTAAAADDPAELSEIRIGRRRLLQRERCPSVPSPLLSDRIGLISSLS